MGGRVICTKCNKEGELKTFSTFQYYYCNSCKDEISLEEVSDSNKRVKGRDIKLTIQDRIIDNPRSVDFWYGGQGAFGSDPIKYKGK